MKTKEHSSSYVFVLEKEWKSKIFIGKGIQQKFLKSSMFKTFYFSLKRFPVLELFRLIIQQRYFEFRILNF